ncbi:hypothetical protein CKAH01_05372 [Colletotrichum kahawae]|uniref:Uncharacterized protein n=1 Tax=Colletotrichum kahawae TaxID=34407 RepID=A0AAD9YEB6_COLKA|nr:hypothetical protein CKAH01_05372 [Colletotrichum kahawae]
MSSRIERLEKENRQLQTRFAIEQTLNKRKTLSFEAKEKELCRVQEAFSKLWQAHRRQLNNGLEGSDIEGLTWGADDAEIYLDSLYHLKWPWSVSWDGGNHHGFSTWPSEGSYDWRLPGTLFMS